jgi:uncharacterized protein
MEDRSTRRPFRARTVLIPAAGMAGHIFTSTVVSIVFVFVIMAQLMTRQGIGSTADMATIMATLGQDATDALMDLSTRIALVYSIVQIALFLPLFAYLRWREPAFYPTLKPRPLQILSVVAMAAGLSGLIALMFMAAQALGESVPYIKNVLQDYADLSQAFSGDGSMVWIVVSTCIAVPIAEELIFRGLIMNELRRVMPLWLAVVLQGVLFALFHMNTVQTLYVLIPGILLGAVYAWTRSIAVPIAMHIAFNLVGAALPQALGEGPAYDVLFIVECVFIVVGALCAIWLYLDRAKGSVPPQDAAGTASTTT